jgi:hypothetical protein
MAGNGASGKAVLSWLYNAKSSVYAVLHAYAGPARDGAGGPEGRDMHRLLNVVFSPVPRLGTLWRDLRYAARSLARARAFTAVCVLSLGIGMTPVIAIPYAFHVLNKAVTPRGVKTDGLVEVLTKRVGPRAAASAWSYPDFTDLRAADTGLVLVGWANGESTQTFATPAGPETRVVSTKFVTANYFRTFGIALARGPGFDAAMDDAPRTDPVVILGYDFWQHELGADPNVIGTRLTFDNVPYVVVGIAPRLGVDERQIFMPLERDPHLSAGAAREASDWRRPGLSTEAAREASDSPTSSLSTEAAREASDWRRPGLSTEAAREASDWPKSSLPTGAAREASDWPTSSLSTGAAREASDWRRSEWIHVNGRLLPGVSIAQASAAVGAVTSRLAAAYPATNALKAGIVEAYDPLGVLQRPQFRILQTVALTLTGVVLLVVCLNVSGMMQVRYAMRERELASCGRSCPRPWCSRVWAARSRRS